MQEVWSEHTKALPPLKVGDCVRVQNQIGSKPRRWDKTGIVVEVKQFDQYVIRMDGSGRVSLRNRRFLKRYEPMFPVFFTFLYLCADVTILTKLCYLSIPP